MRWVLLWVAVAVLIPGLASQSLVNQATLLRTVESLGTPVGDTALRCEVIPLKPTLDFGFRLLAGYTFRLPLNQFSGPGHRLIAVTRITSDASPSPTFLIDTIAIPPVPPTDREGEVSGGYFVGEGHYLVNWMLLDERGRSCRKDWEVHAGSGHGSRRVKLAMPPNQVADLSSRWSSAPSRHLDAIAPVRLTVFLDAAPVFAAGAVRLSLSPNDQVFLLGGLSALLERIPATTVRLVAFNLEQQKELFRQESFAPNSLNELSRELKQLQLSTVDYRALQSPAGHLHLLAGLINQELRAQPPSDLVIFFGSRERFHDKLPTGALLKRTGTTPRFFFLRYQMPGGPANSRTTPGAAQGGRGGTKGGGRGSPLGLPPLVADTDIMAGSPPGSDDVPVRAIRTSSPDAPERLPDSVSLAVGSLKGKAISIRSPGQFAKAIEQIERSSGH